MSITIKFKALHPDFRLPEQAHTADAGFDVRYLGSDFVFLKPGERKLLPTGCSVEIPEGYEIQVRPRSGLALKQGLTVLNTPGTIDAHYRGPCGVILLNTSDEVRVIESGDRIAQFVVNKLPTVTLELVEELTNTERGSDGFGSTGVK